MKLIVNTENAQDMEMMRNLLCAGKSVPDERAQQALQADIEMYLEDIRRKDTILTEQEQVLKGLEAKLVQATAEMETLNVQLAENAVAHRTQLEAQAKAAATAQKALAKKEAALAALTQKQSEQEALLTALQAELQTSQQATQALQQQFTEAETAGSELAAKLESATTQLAESQTEVRSLREQNAALSQVKRDLKAQHESLEATLACAQLTNDALTADKQMAEAAVQELRNKLMAVQSAVQGRHAYLLQLVQRVLADYIGLANDLSLDGTLALQQTALACLQAQDNDVADAEWAPEVEALRKDITELGLLPVAAGMAPILAEAESARVLSLLGDLRRIGTVGALHEEEVLLPMNEVPIATDVPFGQNHLAQQAEPETQSNGDEVLAVMQEAALLVEAAQASDNGLVAAPVRETVAMEAEEDEAAIDTLAADEEVTIDSFMEASVDESITAEAAHSFIEEACDLAALANKVLASFDSTALDSKKVVMQTESQANVRAYGEMLEPAVKTLLANALASVNGKGKIEVKLAEDEGYHLLQIIDNGKPITNTDALFDSDEPQAHAPTRSGLHTVREIVEMQSGMAGLSVSKSKNNFYIKLPKHN
jgi:signal transduction histidine kinase